MAVRRRKDAQGRAHWVVDLRFRTVAGQTERYRRDAQVQTRAGALAEERRVQAHFVQHGSILTLLHPKSAVGEATWSDAVKRFREVTFEVGGRGGRGYALNTRQTYESVLRSPHLAKWSARPLSSIDYRCVEGLLATELKTASAALRYLYVAVIRSVIVEYTGSRPSLPRIPRVPSSRVPARDQDLDRIVGETEGGTQPGQREAVRWAIQVTRGLGLRGGETMALQWRDVHLDESVVVVERQLTCGELKPTKGGKSRRVPIPRALRLALEAERRRRSPQPDDFVCIKSDGKPWRCLSRAVRRVLLRLGISGRPLHPIRHTYLTRIARHDPVAAQQIAGHASLQTTMGYVSHLDDARKGAAVAAAFEDD